MTHRTLSSIFLSLISFTLLPLAFESASRAADPKDTATVNADDPYLWLEDVTAEKSLDWVKAQNALSTHELQASPQFETIRKQLLTILNSKERIPYVTSFGKYFYNFWIDEKNPRGLWRRTTLEEYRKPEPAWETVINVDQLAANEKENWIWKGAVVLEPEYDRAMISLSHGGADASVLREFDLTKKEFIANGFTVLEAKSDVAWRDRDTLYVGTDFGPGTTTKSGYSRIIKQWQRGTLLSAATIVKECPVDEMGISVTVLHNHGETYDIISRSPTFFTSQEFIRHGDDWVRVEMPDDAILRFFGKYLLLQLRSDWTTGGATYKAGSLIAIKFDAFLDGERKFVTLFQPTPTTSLAGISETKTCLVLNVLDNVRSRPALLRLTNDKWEPVPFAASEIGSISVSGVDPNTTDDYFMTIDSYLTPTSLYLGTTGETKRELLKQLPQLFDAKGLQIEQFEATSRDGTKIPYFQVSRKDLKLDGTAPTLLYGYGGFEISMEPHYTPTVGAAWLERGGVYVVANIRGGGEFGPQWHQAALKENRQRAYDDFIAVAESLISRKVTSPKHLGIQGGSNGGLLMGVMLTERPDLFGAIVCQVPLLDMRRYNKLLAGASWMDEYGDPDKPEDWAYLSKFSPYQNVFKEKQYPRVLFTTSTRDDRVHPGHARKMVARMKEQEHDVLYYENIEGGHGGAANNDQRAFMQALAYTFLWQELTK